MLLSEAITMTLKRTGLSITSTPNKDQARLYLNAIANRIVGRAEWWWLFKSATLTTVADQRIYSLAADVQVPYSFTDQTNGQTLPFKGWDYFDAVDPEQDETGDAGAVTIEGDRFHYRVHCRCAVPQAFHGVGDYPLPILGLCP
mgnify:CR=1 FL=1